MIYRQWTGNLLVLSGETSRYILNKRFIVDQNRKLSKLSQNSSYEAGNSPRATVKESFLRNPKTYFQ